MILHPYHLVRRGVTLLEVLTAIFIMGIGLLAILTLFPLGALSMARAVRDDRAAAAGANASVLAIAQDLRNDAAVLNAVAPGSLVTPPTGYTFAADGPGYPVLVDPVYANLPSGSPLGAAGGTFATPGIQRFTPSYVTLAPQPAQAIARWFTFQDEMGFEKNGQAVTSPAALRPGTYTWTYMLRRPRPLSPALTELSVIVYSNRATDQVTGENTYNSGGTMGLKGTNTVLLTFTGDRPNIRKGGWILDTSYRPVLAGGGTVNGYFYQVASVTDTDQFNLTLELETALKEDVTTAVVLENVITVLERGTSWRP